MADSALLLSSVGQWHKPELSQREVEVMLAWLLTDFKAEVCSEFTSPRER